MAIGTSATASNLMWRVIVPPLLPDLRRAAGKVITLRHVIGAELLHARDAAVDHLDHFLSGHRRHVHRDVALHIEMTIGDVVQPAVTPPLEILLTDLLSLGVANSRIKRESYG